jgi:hypothetical protein
MLITVIVVSALLFVLVAFYIVRANHIGTGRPVTPSYWRACVAIGGIRRRLESERTCRAIRADAARTRRELEEELRDFDRRQGP